MIRRHVYIVKVWDEGKSYRFSSRTCEVVLPTYALARDYRSRAKRILGWKLDKDGGQKDVRSPGYGIEITPVVVYETVDDALSQSWPFEELRP